MVSHVTNYKIIMLKKILFKYKYTIYKLAQKSMTLL